MSGSAPQAPRARAPERWRLPANPSSTRLHTSLGTSKRASPADVPSCQSEAAPACVPDPPAQPAPPPPAAALAPDSSLSSPTLHALLQPSAAGPLGWGARQAREQRRRDMLQLQRWLEVEEDRLTKSLAAESKAGSTHPEALTAAANKGRVLYDQVVAELAHHVASADLGAGGEVSEILTGVWRGYTGLTRRVQDGLRREADMAWGRVRDAEAVADAACQELARRQAADSAVTPSSSGHAGADHMQEAILTQQQHEVVAAAHQEGSRPGDTLERNEVAMMAVTAHRSEMAAMEQLERENTKLRKAAELAGRELLRMRNRAAALEAAADELVEAETRAAAAQAERSAALQQQQGLTPRPSLGHHELRALVGAEALDLTLAALKAHEHMPPADLAQLLLCDPATEAAQTAAPAASQPDAPAVQQPAQDAGAPTNPVLPSSATNNVAATQNIPATNQPALQQDNTAPAAAEGEQQAAHPPPAATDGSNSTSSPHTVPNSAATDAAPAATAPPAPLAGPASTFFRGSLRGVSAEALTAALSHTRGSTAQRYAALEAEAAALRTQCAALTLEVEATREAERRREAARRRHDEEALLEKKNPLQQYLELLESQGEDAWKENLIGMGQGAEVPKLFRHAGKIRNKHLSKRDTEKLVKEVWKERLLDPAVAAGRAGDLVDFVATHLQKKVGITAAVLELGYNFFYSLWQYRWDADCELFLKILTGETSEGVYIAQARLQADLEELFAALDKAKGQPTGLIPKEDLRVALQSFFRVGESSGKSAARFDEALQALAQDQPNDVIDWKAVFAEDREFNQGEFAECIRDQFLQERMEFFTALETALYEEGDGRGDCTKEQVIRAILLADPQTTEKAATAVVNSAFYGGIDSLSVKATMKKLSRGLLKGGPLDRVSTLGRAAGRASTIDRASVSVGKQRGSMAPASAERKGGLMGAAKQQNEMVGKALEAVRLHWIQRQLGQTARKGEEEGGDV